MPRRLFASWLIRVRIVLLGLQVVHTLLQLLDLIQKLLAALVARRDVLSVPLQNALQGRDSSRLE